MSGESEQSSHTLDRIAVFMERYRDILEHHALLLVALDATAEEGEPVGLYKRQGNQLKQMVKLLDDVLAKEQLPASNYTLQEQFSLVMSTLGMIVDEQENFIGELTRRSGSDRLERVYRKKFHKENEALTEDDFKHIAKLQRGYTRKAEEAMQEKQTIESLREALMDIRADITAKRNIATRSLITPHAVSMVNKFLHRYEVFLKEESDAMRQLSKVTGSHDLNDNRGARLGEFLGALRDIVKTRYLNVAPLLNGMQVLGAEASVLEDYKQYNQKRIDPTRQENHYRRKHNIDADIMLPESVYSGIDNKMSRASGSYYQCRNDRSLLLDIQSDLIDILKEMKIHSRVSPPSETEHRSM